MVYVTNLNKMVQRSMYTRGKAIVPVLIPGGGAPYEIGKASVRRLKRYGNEDKM